MKNFFLSRHNFAIYLQNMIFRNKKNYYKNWRARKSLQNDVSHIFY